MADTQTETTTTQTTETTQQGQQGPDIAAELAAVKTQLAELSKAKADADKAADDAKKASMSESERLASERAAFQLEVESTRKTLTADARNAALDRLGVLPTYRAWAPEVDPRTTDGAQAIEKWAKEHPEVVKQVGTPQAQIQAPAPESKLGKILAGVTSNPYISREGLRKLVSN